MLPVVEGDPLLFDKARGLALANQQTQAELPGVAALSQIRQDQAQLSGLETSDQLIGHALATVDPESPTFRQDADAALQMAAQQGAGQNALQWQGKLTPGRLAELRQVYAPPPPGGARGAGAASQYPGLSDKEAATLDGQLPNMAPADLQSAMQRHGAIIGGLQKVLHAPDAQTAQAIWNQEAASLGFPNVPYPGTMGTSLMLRTAMSREQYLMDRGMLAQGGLPAPPAPADVRDVGGTLLNVNPDAPGGGSASVLYRSQDVHPVGQDPTTGQLIYSDSKGGGETLGANANVGPLPDASVKGGAAELKPFDPVIARKDAQAQAARDLAALNTGINGAPADPQAWLDQRAEQYYQQAVQASQAAPRGGRAGTPTSDAGAAPQFAGNRMNAQQQQWKQQNLHSISGPGGSKMNPIMIYSEQAFDRLPMGAFFVGPDGIRRVKQSGK